MGAGHSHRPTAVTPAAPTSGPAQAQGEDPQATLGNAFLAESARELADGAGGKTSFPDKAAALAHHAKVQGSVQRVLAAGLAHEVEATEPDALFDEDNLLHNTAEWITSGEVRLHVLTPTHDAASRQAGNLAFFDATAVYPSMGTDYPDRGTPGAGSDPRLVYKPKGSHGAMQPGGADLQLIDPKSDADIRHSLIHEVQHDADQSWEGQVHAKTSKKMDKELVADINGYMSEFRAFWIMDGDQFPPADQRATNAIGSAYAQTFPGLKTGFQNARQQAIFWEMVKWSSYNKYLFAYVEDAAFRNVVNSYALPASGNLVNSVRIQKLSDALKGATGADTVESPAIKALLEAAALLDPLDRKFLADRKLSEPLWTQAKRALGEGALQAFSRAVA